MSFAASASFLKKVDNFGVRMVGSKRVARIKRKIRAVESARAIVAKVAVGYVRVSTDEQAATGFGLATQEAAIRAFAASQGYELLEVITCAVLNGDAPIEDMSAAPHALLDLREPIHIHFLSLDAQEQEEPQASILDWARCLDSRH